MVATSPLIAPLPGLMIWTLVTFGLTFWFVDSIATVIVSLPVFGSSATFFEIKAAWSG